MQEKISTVADELRIVKIAVTGGPCAGKTTLMSRAVQELSQRGIEVLICPEAATSLIAGMNVKPGLFPDDGFQKFIMQQQFFNEKMLEDIAKSAAAETGHPVVILCDRGKLDSLAYAPENVIHKLLQKHGSNLSDGKDFSFFYTEKQAAKNPDERFEKERMISAKDYLAFLAEADYRSIAPIQKDRYCFPYCGQYLELDIYVGEKDYAILEIEFSDDGSKIVLPPEISVAAEVTGDEQFSNRYIAGRGGRFPDNLPRSAAYAFLPFSLE